MSFPMKLYEKEPLDFVQNTITGGVSTELRFRQFVGRAM